MALGRKETLAALLKPGESPWQFEMRGTERSRESGERFLCASMRRFGIDYVFTAIVNGYWTKHAHEYAKAEILFIPFDTLPSKPLTKRLIDKLRALGYKAKRKLQ